MRFASVTLALTLAAAALADDAQATAAAATAHTQLPHGQPANAAGASDRLHKLPTATQQQQEQQEHPLPAQGGAVPTPKGAADGTPAWQRSRRQ